MRRRHHAAPRLLRSPSHENDSTTAQLRSTATRELPQSQSQPITYDFSHVDLFSHAPQRKPIQMKLTVGAAHDQHEQEADHVVEQVLNTPDAATPPVQRQEEAEADELQTKPIQRQESAADERQTKPSTPHSPTSSLETQLNSSKSGGSPLPESVRSFMEPRFGADFSQVKVHTGSDSIQMNCDLNAQAFTHGQNVFFGAGKAPANDALTAHELTHVVQQGAAPVVQSRPIQPNAATFNGGVQLRSQVPSIQRALNWTRSDLETGAGTTTFRSTVVPFDKGQRKSRVAIMT